MSLMIRHGSSRLVAMSMNQQLWAASGKSVLASAHGDILEIGFGSGANLGFHPEVQLAFHDWDSSEAQSTMTR